MVSKPYNGKCISLLMHLGISPKARLRELPLEDEGLYANLLRALSSRVVQD